MKKLLLALCFVALAVLTAQAQSQSPLRKFKGTSKHQVSKNQNRHAKKATIYPDSIESFFYDFNTMSYQPERYSVEYQVHDQDGNLTEEVRVYSSSRTKYQYSYSNGIAIVTTEFEWNPISKQWFPIEKTILNYSPQGYLIEEDEQSYDTNSLTWASDFKIHYMHMYDAQNRVNEVKLFVEDVQGQSVDTIIHFKYVYSGSDTVPSEAFVYEYDNGWDTLAWAYDLEWEAGFEPNIEDYQPTFGIYDSWDGALWVKDGYDSASVDQGKIIDYFSFSYDTDSIYYTKSYSDHYRFDQYGSEIENTSIDWEYGLPDTSYKNVHVFTYGSSGEILEDISSRFSFFSGPGPVQEIRTKSIYYYGQTGINKAEPLISKVYPNPISNGSLLKLESEQVFDKIRLINQTGKMVKEWDTYENGLEINGILPGIYFVQVINISEGVQTIKLIVQ